MSEDKTQNGSATPDPSGVKNLLMSANWEDQLREARARREKVLANKRTADPSSRPKPWDQGSAKDRSETQIDETLLSAGVKRGARPAVKRREQAKPDVPEPASAQPEKPAPLPPLVPASEPLVETVAHAQAPEERRRGSRIGIIAACMFVVGTTLGAGVAWQIAQPTSAAPANVSASRAPSAEPPPTTATPRPSESPAATTVAEVAPELRSISPAAASIPAPVEQPQLARAIDLPEPGAIVPGMLAPVLPESGDPAVVGASPEIMQQVVAQQPVDTDDAGLPARFSTLDEQTNALRYAPFRLAAIGPDTALTLPEQVEIAALLQAPRQPAAAQPVTAPNLPKLAAAPQAAAAPVRLAAAAPASASTSAEIVGASIQTDVRVAVAPDAGFVGPVASDFTLPTQARTPILAMAPAADALPTAATPAPQVARWAGASSPAAPVGDATSTAPSLALDDRPMTTAPAAVELAALEETLPNVLEYARISVLNSVDGLAGVASAAQTPVISSAQPPAPRPILAAMQPGILPDQAAAALAPLPRPKPAFVTTFVRVHAPSAVETDKVEAVMSQVSGSGIGTVDLKRVDLRISRDNVRYFHAEDAKAAAAVAEATGAVLRDFTDFSPSPPTGSIEYWVAGTRKGGSTVAAAPTRTPQRATTSRRTVTVTRNGPTAEERRLRAVQQRIIQRLRRGGAF